MMMMIFVVVVVVVVAAAAAAAAVVVVVFLLSLRWPESGDMWHVIFLLLDAVVPKCLHRWHTNMARVLLCSLQ
jgi:hypothetical protein